jgi:hypothetical protein
MIAHAGERLLGVDPRANDRHHRDLRRCASDEVAEEDHPACRVLPQAVALRVVHGREQRLERSRSPALLRKRHRPRATRGPPACSERAARRTRRGARKIACPGRALWRLITTRSRGGSRRGARLLPRRGPGRKTGSAGSVLPSRAARGRATGPPSRTLRTQTSAPSSLYRVRSDKKPRSCAGKPARSSPGFAHHGPREFRDRDCRSVPAAVQIGPPRARLRAARRPQQRRAAVAADRKEAPPNTRRSRCRCRSWASSASSCPPLPGISTAASDFGGCASSRCFEIATTLDHFRAACPDIVGRPGVIDVGFTVPPGRTSSASAHEDAETRHRPDLG